VRTVAPDIESHITVGAGPFPRRWTSFYAPWRHWSGSQIIVDYLCFPLIPIAYIINPSNRNLITRRFQSINIVSKLYNNWRLIIIPRGFFRHTPAREQSRHSGTSTVAESKQVSSFGRRYDSQLSGGVESVQGPHTSTTALHRSRDRVSSTCYVRCGHHPPAKGNNGLELTTRNLTSRPEF
jgi:hypothetical protein